MDHKELKKLIEFLRKSGVKTYKTPQIELELMPAPPKRAYRKKSEEAIEQPEVNENDVLFWSSTNPLGVS